ncbi:hypothetical protein PR202_gb08222 [Eleusine coracana subsp. coracana]|uniref:Beta-amylase n=1 Tax=Eleusine coracana subsp. coracana TaxID=191504 RepID=A0AAV5EEZ3_ELECO|nr:hypothetical protein PR202_gb08222 [Eleusine coracana subsp. coracana]
MRKAASSAGSLRLQRQACCEPSVAPAMSVACKAVAESAAAAAGRKSGVPVFVMMPLDTVKKCGSALNRRKAVQASLAALKSAGVEGVMVDVWWGIAEAEGPGRYNFAGYMELMEMARKTGLKVQAVMSFHQCGGNVGDSVTIPLPRWVVEEMERDNDLCYTDQWGHRNFEYVSLGCDAMPVLKGRTPVECYTDFMRAFRDHFADYLGNTIIEIQVGMGPAGELRYPSYPESNGIWKFPGIGAFQCNDRYMLSSLKAAAEAAGKPEWGHGAPTDAGGYHSWPEDTLFFKRDNGGWSTEYGDFFLSWYSQMLIDHGDRVLTGATSVYSGTPGVEVSVKVAGIHWHYGTRSHAPELTAGYYNTRARATGTSPSRARWPATARSSTSPASRCATASSRRTRSACPRRSCGRWRPPPAPPAWAWPARTRCRATTARPTTRWWPPRPSAATPRTGWWPSPTCAWAPTSSTRTTGTGSPRSCDACPARRDTAGRRPSGRRVASRRPRGRWYTRRLSRCGADPERPSAAGLYRALICWVGFYLVPFGREGKARARRSREHCILLARRRRRSCNEAGREGRGGHTHKLLSRSGIYPFPARICRNVCSVLALAEPALPPVASLCFFPAYLCFYLWPTPYV